MKTTHPNSPKGLPILSVMQGIGGFNYYGFISVITLFLILHFGVSTDKAYSMYGLLLAFSYITPLVGGVLADKFFDSKSTLLLSFIFMALGYFLIAYGNKAVFYYGITLALFGVGALKPCANVLLAQGYEQQSNQSRDKAFSIMYAAINAGAVLAPFVLGVFASGQLWSWVFAVSGLMSLLGVLVFWIAYRQQIRYTNLIKGIISAGVLSTICAVLLIYQELFKLLLILAVILMCGYAVYAVYKNHKEKLGGIFYLLCLNIIVVLFFSAELQFGGSLEIFIAHHINMKLGSFTIPAESYALLLPLFVAIGITVCIPIVNILKKKSFVVTTLSRSVIGLLLCALSFLVFALTTVLAGRHSNVLVLVLGVILGYMAMGFGEIIFAPTVTSATAVLAPPKMRATFMGIYYVFSALAGWLAGVISETTINQHSGKVDYFNTFISISIALVVISVLIVIAYLVVRKTIKPGHKGN